MMIGQDGVLFFLKALCEQSEYNLQKAREIVVLYKSIKEQVPTLTRSPYTVQIIDGIFSKPIFSVASFATSMDIPSRTARRILEKLYQEGVLSLSSKKGTNKTSVFEFSALLKILNEEPSF